MKPVGNLPTLDQPLAYEIRVCGHIEESWSSWIEATTTPGESQEAGIPVSVITGTFDQAALHGLLRRLYSLGFPLISVKWLTGLQQGGRE
jgi:hypothetical protein